MVRWLGSRWTTLFTKMLEHVADLDFKTNGYWKTLRARRTVKDKVRKKVSLLLGQALPLP
jgi:hypothetical protein